MRVVQVRRGCGACMIIMIHAADAYLPSNIGIEVSGSGLGVVWVRV